MAAKRKTPKRAAKSGPNKPGQNKSEQKAGRGKAAGAFCARARAALKRGVPDAISDRELQQILTAAAKIYAAKVERRGHDVAPFAPGMVTATETVVTACGMIRAADLNMFDVAIWFHRPQGIE
jgi:hypothetical protein